MKKWQLVDVTTQKPLKKWTPQGELDSVWNFDTEEEGRAAAERIGYAEELKGYFSLIDKTQSRYNKKPRVIKLVEKEQNVEKENCI